MPDVSYTVRLIRGTPVVATPEEIDVTSADALHVELLASAECGHAVVACRGWRRPFASDG
jgi:hypothetical protein